jgi:hypothetical protein
MNRTPSRSCSNRNGEELPHEGLPSGAAPAFTRPALCWPDSGPTSLWSREV